MKTLSISCLFALLLSFAVTSCNKNEVEPDPPAPEPAAEAAPASPSEPEPSPASNTADIDAELNALISALDKGDGATGKSFADLPEDQRQTLQAAIEKAVKDLDFGLLTTSLGANLGSIESSSVKVLSAEEAKELGIDLEGIRQGAPGVSVQSRIISIGIAGADSGDPVDSAEPADSPDGDETIEDQAQQLEIIETQQVDDPAATQRIQELLEAGDSDALAGELTKLLQSGIDSASLQQLLGQ